MNKSFVRLANFWSFVARGRRSLGPKQRLTSHWSEAPWRSIYKFCIIPFESTPLFQIIIE